MRDRRVQLELAVARDIDATLRACRTRLITKKKPPSFRLGEFHISKLSLLRAKRVTRFCEAGSYKLIARQKQLSIVFATVIQTKQGECGEKH